MDAGTVSFLPQQQHLPSWWMSTWASWAGLLILRQSQSNALALGASGVILAFRLCRNVSAPKMVPKNSNEFSLSAPLRSLTKWGMSGDGWRTLKVNRTPDLRLVTVNVALPPRMNVFVSITPIK